MHRIQVQLTPAQERGLREAARLRGQSISALIREGVDRVLDPSVESQDDQWTRAASIIGKYRSKSGNDAAEKHDVYFAEAIRPKRRMR